jgi:hypothetical protein
MDIEMPENISYEQLKEELSRHVNQLIEHDFQKLVAILYRIDVNEEKLKFMLLESADRDASLIITELIIERQLQKIKFRQEFRRENNISEEEKW